MISATFVCGIVALLASNPSADPPIPLAVSGTWKVRVGPGAIPGANGTIALQAPVELEVRPAVSVTVRDEKHEKIPVYDPNAGGWARGARPRGVIAEECAAKGMLDPASLRLKSAPGPEGKAFELGRDYELDPEWGCFGRTAAGGLGAEAAVYVDYVHGLGRLDSIVLTREGKVILRPGEARISLQRPPPLERGDTLIANVWVAGRSNALGPDAIFPVLETRFPEGASVRPTPVERLCPRSIEKLRKRGVLRVLAWGDSVTDGSYLGDPSKRWQCRFAARLEARYPGAKVEVIHLGWGGRSTDSFLAEPPGSPWNYQEKVLGAKADLVVSEFVNDAWMDPARVEERYGRLLTDLRAAGSEWIILTPHYVRGDWMGLDRAREIDEDPRPYVKGLRAFAAAHDVALADASLRWGRLWRQGIPYITLLGNMINHPDAPGMELFADALLAIFPPE